MSVAIRAITRLQEADDVNVTLGAGVDEHALCWDNDTARFVLRAVATGGLLATGATTGATSQAQAFTNGIIGPSWKPAADSTTALQLQNAAGASVLNVDTTNKRIGIGTTAPSYPLDVAGSAQVFRSVQNVGGGEPIMAWARTGHASQNNEWAVSITSVSTTNGALVIRPSVIGTTSDIMLAADNARLYYVVLKTSGRFGIGTESPVTLIHGLLTSAATNTVTNVLTIGHDTSGTAANGFGAGELFALESSTTAAQNAARIRALWYDATHATRKADLVLSAYDTSEREGLRIRGNGSAPAIGFLGATPALRVAHVADPAGGGTVDAEARSAINSILATLETFGFHATS